MKISKPLHKKWFYILKDPEFLSGKPADRKAVEERFLAVFLGTVIFSSLEKIEDSRRDFFFSGTENRGRISVGISTSSAETFKLPPKMLTSSCGVASDSDP